MGSHTVYKIILTFKILKVSIYYIIAKHNRMAPIKDCDKFILGNFLIGRPIMSLSRKCVSCEPAVLYSLFRFWKRDGEV